ncbi:pentapeptide repeat protein [Williamsia limnetica]|uniref:Pentapeptide repeat protein n=1 Tax=Williamsia limnetica TaxID=882452 RepID=A0A318RLN9_WILLI|nr:pentapeptide repeat-containing protein [Williamsia limnetica]PYE19233.1 pentapeptide repeat protein [Williamsia limnetica]
MNSSAQPRSTSTRSHLRRVRPLLVAAAAIALAGLTTPAVASADVVIKGCTIVANPTYDTHTVCRNMDLSGIDLSEQSDLDYADFTGSNMSGLALSSSLLDQVTFAGVNLSGADFSSRTIFRTDFTDADLTGASFAGSFLADPIAVDASFVEVDLTSTRLIYGDFTNTDFTGATLSGTRFENSTMTGANFSKTIVVPADQQLTSTGPGTVAEWTLPAGLADTVAATECTPASGSAFPAGATTTVRCVVAGGGDTEDANEGEGFGTFTVTVSAYEPPEPPEPPAGSSGSSVGGLFG